MFEFLIRNTVAKSTQGSINRLTPKVNIHLHKELPLPSLTIVRKMASVVSKINGLEEKISKLSDAELRAKTDEFKNVYQEKIKAHRAELTRNEEAYKKATTPQEREELNTDWEEVKSAFKKARQQALDEILPEAFAVVRETGKRILNMRHFDVQLIGGMVLHQGSIAEMATGEGKTLVATLPAYLNALTGDGVHVVTVNDYLAKRDREWMGPLYEFLGLTVGVIQHDMDAHERQHAYSCDITYGTNNEFGFDYLRDNMVNFKSEMVQTKHTFAIVDEVDSILIDEARTPLIISGPAEESTDIYYRANEIAKKLSGRRVTEQQEIDAKHKNEDLTKGFDYIADEKGKSVSLTEPGEVKIAQLFGVANLHDMDTIEYRHHILQALRAREFFHIDVDYVVRDGQVIIVDEFTGRLMPGRRWSDGLHQAVESKEGIKIERENQTLATITFQNYFRMYDKLAGMTGTAHTEANEFKQIYKLDCLVIPTNRVLSRRNYADSIYKTVKEKFTAVVEQIAELHKKGQPVLVGTISIAKSELLSLMLKQKGIPHQVLNAKYHELEAQIVAQAGRYKAVTIATNMAGRGTDILLGGNAEFLAKSLAAEKAKEKDGGEPQEELVKKFLEQFRQQVKEEHEKVVEAGGLFVLGTERHESRRIDNQLRGRSGRQGDPGESRFFVSLEDDLMRLFASDRIMTVMDKLGMEDGQVIEHPWVTKAIEIAQKRVENHNFEIRKQLLEFDNVMNTQREVIYGLRRSILESDSVRDYILETIEEIIPAVIGQFGKLNEMEHEAIDADGLILYARDKFHLDLSQVKEKLSGMSKAEAEEMFRQGLLRVYEDREKHFEQQQFRQMEKMVLLHTIDVKWKEHLYAMDQLKEGIGLRSFAQRDPVVEYKREGFSMFQLMHEVIQREVIETIFRVEPVSHEMRMKSVFSAIPQKLIHKEFSSLANAVPPAAGQIPQSGSAPAAGPAAPRHPAAPQPIHNEGPKVGRNDPCPCGSGKKYKKCHGQ